MSLTPQEVAAILAVSQLKNCLKDNNFSGDDASKILEALKNIKNAYKNALDAQEALEKNKDETPVSKRAGKILLQHHTDEAGKRVLPLLKDLENHTGNYPELNRMRIELQRIYGGDESLSQADALQITYDHLLENIKDGGVLDPKEKKELYADIAFVKATYKKASASLKGYDKLRENHTTAHEAAVKASQKDFDAKLSAAKPIAEKLLETLKPYHLNADGKDSDINFVATYTEEKPVLTGYIEKEVSDSTKREYGIILQIPPVQDSSKSKARIKR